MKVITAPAIYTPKENEIKCFLAGGITQCENWQEEVIELLSAESNLDNLVVYNPRRKNFDVFDSAKAQEQIVWEFMQLEKMDIFSMYFCNSPSVQPICWYELGRNLVRMQQRFPNDWRTRIGITIESDYSREFDVRMQSLLATDGGICFAVDPKGCAQIIINAYKQLRGT